MGVVRVPLKVLFLTGDMKLPDDVCGRVKNIFGGCVSVVEEMYNRDLGEAFRRGLIRESYNISFDYSFVDGDLGIVDSSCRFIVGNVPFKAIVDLGLKFNCTFYVIRGDFNSGLIGFATCPPTGFGSLRARVRGYLWRFLSDESRLRMFIVDGLCRVVDEFLSKFGLKLRREG